MVEILLLHGIGGVFIHVDDTGFTGMRGGKRFEKELLGGFGISGWAEEEIERVALRINGSVEIDPLFFHLNRGLIDQARESVVGCTWGGQRRSSSGA